MHFVVVWITLYETLFVDKQSISRYKHNMKEDVKKYLGLKVRAIREAAGMTQEELAATCDLLLQGADITAYDPKAMGTACGLLGNKISYADDMYGCLKDADVLAILTEWNEFKALDLVQAAHLMRHKQIVDCRNLINAEQAAANGFDYQGIGIKKVEKENILRGVA